MKLGFTLAVVAFLLSFTAAGSTIGPVCGSCQGGIYSLTDQVVSIGGVSDEYKIFLNIDDTSYTGSGTFINSVAFKVSSSITSFSLISATGGVGVWSTQLSGLNANGCGGGGSGFGCSESSSGLGAPVSNINNSFVWDVIIPHGTLLTDTNTDSFKVLYVNAAGAKVGDVVSENITLSSVPEPSTLFSAIGGLAIIAGLIRFKKKETQLST